MKPLHDVVGAIVPGSDQLELGRLRAGAGVETPAVPVALEVRRVARGSLGPGDAQAEDPGAAQPADQPGVGLRAAGGMLNRGLAGHARAQSLAPLVERPERGRGVGCGVEEPAGERAGAAHAAGVHRRPRGQQQVAGGEPEAPDLHGDPPVVPVEDQDLDLRRLPRGQRHVVEPVEPAEAHLLAVADAPLDPELHEAPRRRLAVKALHGTAAGRRHHRGIEPHRGGPRIAVGPGRLHAGHVEAGQGRVELQALPPGEEAGAVAPRVPLVLPHLEGGGAGVLEPHAPQTPGETAVETQVSGQVGVVAEAGVGQPAAQTGERRSRGQDVGDPGRRHRRELVAGVATPRRIEVESPAARVERDRRGHSLGEREAFDVQITADEAQVRPLDGNPPERRGQRSARSVLDQGDAEQPAQVVDRKEEQLSLAQHLEGAHLTAVHDRPDEHRLRGGIVGRDGPRHRGQHHEESQQSRDAGPSRPEASSIPLPRAVHRQQRR